MTIPYRPLPMPHDMPIRLSDEPIIQEMTVPSEFANLLLSRRDKAHVLVLPRALGSANQKCSASSKAPYIDLDLIETSSLRRRGVDIDTLHDKEEQRLYSQFSADVVIALGIFIAQVLAEHEITAIYTYLRQRIANALALLDQSGQEDVRTAMNINVLRAKKTSDGLEIVAKGISGPAEETTELVIRIIRELNDDESHEKLACQQWD
jgi:hypothetical protein